MNYLTESPEWITFYPKFSNGVYIEKDATASDVEAIVKRMGFEEVDYELEATDVCDKCGEHPQRLFFGMRDYWDFREGEYWCADCIVKRYEADQKWIKEMDAKLEAGCA